MKMSRLPFGIAFPDPKNNFCSLSGQKQRLVLYGLSYKLKSKENFYKLSIKLKLYLDYNNIKFEHNFKISNNFS